MHAHTVHGPNRAPSWLVSSPTYWGRRRDEREKDDSLPDWGSFSILFRSLIVSSRSSCFKSHQVSLGREFAPHFRSPIYDYCTPIQSSKDAIACDVVFLFLIMLRRTCEANGDDSGTTSLLVYQGKRGVSDLKRGLPEHRKQAGRAVNPARLRMNHAENSQWKNRKIHCKGFPNCPR